MNAKRKICNSLRCNAFQPENRTLINVCITQKCTVQTRVSRIGKTFGCERKRFLLFCVCRTAGTRVRRHVAIAGIAGRARRSPTAAAGRKSSRPNGPGHTAAQSAVHGVGHQGTGPGRQQQRHLAGQVGAQDPDPGIELEGDFSFFFFFSDTFPGTR